MDVCYIASHAINSVPEGHNIASVRIIQSAFDSGINAKVVTLENEDTSQKANYYPIKTFSIAKRRTSIFPPLGETLSSFNAMLVTKNLDVDLIHLLNITKEVFLFTKKLVKINRPFITHFFHSSYPFKFSYTNFQLRLFLLKLGFFNYVFCSNKSLWKFLIDNSILDKKKIKYIPFPINEKLFKPRDKQKLREKHGFPPDSPIILYVGQIDPNRGFYHVLKSFRKLLNAMPESLLYICHPNLKGEEQEYASLFRYLTSPSLKDNIVISGPTPLIAEVYSLADVITIPFIQPYWITAPPLVFLEAMASGTPIITTPLDVIKDIGVDKKNVLFTAPDDVDSLFEALVYVMNNSDIANDIGLNAREYAIRNHSMGVVSDILKKSYREII